MPRVCSRCLREVYFAEEKLALGKVWHTFCFSCCKCRKLLDSYTVTTHNGEIFCKNCLRAFSPVAKSLTAYTNNNAIKSISTKNRKSPSLESLPQDALLMGGCCYCCTRDYFLAGNGKAIDQSEEKSRLRGGGRTKEAQVECDINHCYEDKESIPCNQKSSSTPITAWYNQKQTNSTSYSSINCQNCHKNLHPLSTLASGTSAACPKFNNVSVNTYSASAKPGRPCRPISQEQHQQLRQQQQRLKKIDDLESNSLQFQSTLNGDDKEDAYTNQKFEPLELEVNNPSQKSKTWAYPPLPPHHTPPPKRRVSFSDTILEDSEEDDLPLSPNCRIVEDVQNEENNNDINNDKLIYVDDEHHQVCSVCECSCIGENNEFNDKVETNSMEVDATLEKDSRMRGGYGSPGENCICKGNINDHLENRNKKICQRSVKKISEVLGCGASGCCGSGCRGGCGKLDQLCMPLRTCSRPHSFADRSHWSSSKSGAPQSTSRCKVQTLTTQNTTLNHNVLAANRRSGNSEEHIVNEEDECGEIQKDVNLKQHLIKRKLRNYDSFGGGFNCQRCGQKVYQAEIKIAAGAPYHNICFSCHCCRKPLEPLTYQENCGKIYCKR